MHTFLTVLFRFAGAIAFLLIVKLIARAVYWWVPPSWRYELYRPRGLATMTDRLRPASPVYPHQTAELPRYHGDLPAKVCHRG